MDKQEKYRATLIGCAIGDTLGMPVESWNKNQIIKYTKGITRPIAPFFVYDGNGNKLEHDEFGKLRYYFAANSKIGDYTDDTILTLALAESIVEKSGLDLSDVARKQLAEYESRILPDGTSLGGFGFTTVEAFKNLQKGMSPLESGVIGGPGNAPAMKMSPVGMYMAATGKYEEGIQFAEKTGRITHLDPRSIASGVIQAQAVYLLINGITREEFVKEMASISKSYEKPLTEKFTWHEKGNLTSRLEWIKENYNVEAESAFKILGSKSSVYQSYPFALFMFQKYWDNPIEGLLETVNFGGDCDTTGAMFGVLAGARNGMVFPDEWLDVLQGKERIIALADKIYDFKR